MLGHKLFPSGSEGKPKHLLCQQTAPALTCSRGWEFHKVYRSQRRHKDWCCAWEQAGAHSKRRQKARDRSQSLGARIRHSHWAQTPPGHSTHCPAPPEQGASHPQGCSCRQKQLPLPSCRHRAPAVGRNLLPTWARRGFFSVDRCFRVNSSLG